MMTSRPSGIFQSTSREGSDLIHTLSKIRLLRFQSTLPRRERPPPWLDTPPAIPISIHAPAKGATSKFLLIAFSLCVFQSTLPRRERRKSLKQTESSEIFQSTLPRRERLETMKLIAMRGYFNPRSREGSDVNVMFKKKQGEYFNPRSREGSDKAQKTN